MPIAPDLAQTLTAPAMVILMPGKTVTSGGSDVINSVVGPAFETWLVLHFKINKASKNRHIC